MLNIQGSACRTRWPVTRLPLLAVAVPWTCLSRSGELHGATAPDIAYWSNAYLRGLNTQLRVMNAHLCECGA